MNRTKGTKGLYCAKEYGFPARCAQWADHGGDCGPSLDDVRRKWKKTCPRCKQRAPCLSKGDFKACPNCYVEEFGEWQTDDICGHGNDANHVPCEKCWTKYP